jgi:Flp pilus assembly protein CpaB
VKPGDFVAVMATFGEGDMATAVTKIVLPKARVLGIDQNLTSVEPTAAATQQDGTLMNAGGNAEQEVVNTVTLAVSPADAEKLVFADDVGRLRLALISKSDASLAKTKGAAWEAIHK